MYDWANYYEEGTLKYFEGCYSCGDDIEGEPVVEAHFTLPPHWDVIRYFHVDCYTASIDEDDAWPEGLAR